MPSKPPRNVVCYHCQTEHPPAHHDRVVRNHTPLYGPWAGWRMAGKDLVSPEGQRITPQRLQGLLWRDLMELRRDGYRSRREAEQGRRRAQCGPKIKVVLIDLDDYRANGVAAG